EPHTRAPCERSTPQPLSLPANVRNRHRNDTTPVHATNEAARGSRQVVRQRNENCRRGLRIRLRRLVKLQPRVPRRVWRQSDGLPTATQITSLDFGPSSLASLGAKDS